MFLEPSYAYSGGSCTATCDSQVHILPIGSTAPTCTNYKNPRTSTTRCSGTTQCSKTGGWGDSPTYYTCAERETLSATPLGVQVVSNMPVVILGPPPVAP
jgi:hypothetical protein